MCEICLVEKTCATCVFSTFERGNTQFCDQRDHCVTDDYFCDHWQPLIVQLLPWEPPMVFGRLDEEPCH